MKLYRSPKDSYAGTYIHTYIQFYIDRYCNVDDKALLGNDSVNQQWKYRCLLVVVVQQTAHPWIRRLAKPSVATVAMQWLSTHVSTMEAKMFSVWSVQIRTSCYRTHEVISRPVNPAHIKFLSSIVPVEFITGVVKQIYALCVCPLNLKPLLLMSKYQVSVTIWNQCSICD
jgi:hypothetical protein